MNAPASSPNALSWTHGVVRAGAAVVTVVALASCGGTTSGPTTQPAPTTESALVVAGCGPYHSGVDPEYDWYIDRDHDGIDCER